MIAIDHNGILDNIALDPGRKIPKVHLSTVCRLHQGKPTCRYIGKCKNQYFCSKISGIKKVLDERVAKGLMSARGDNCEGLGKPVDGTNGKKSS